MTRDTDAPKADGHDPMRAVCAAAGWPFCEEHKRPFTGGSNPSGRTRTRER